MHTYIVQILWLLSWPMIIIASYQILKIALKIYNKSPYSK